MNCMACTSKTFPLITASGTNHTITPYKQLLAYDNDEYILYNKNDYYYIIIEPKYSNSSSLDKKEKKIKNKIKKNKKEYKNVSKIYNMKKNVRKYRNIHQPGRTNCSQRYQSK